jgi:cytochrome P450
VLFDETAQVITRAVCDWAGVPPAESVLDLIARHTETDGRLLQPKRAAVELLNVIRPTVAVSWFVTFAGHVLHRWPQHRERLAAGDREWAVAFAHELRRFYPFAPFVGGLAVRDLQWQGEHIPAKAMVLLTSTARTTTPGCGRTRTGSIPSASSTGNPAATS